MKVEISFYNSKSEEGLVAFHNIVKIDVDGCVLRLLQDCGEVFSGDIAHFTFIATEDCHEKDS